MKIAFLMDPLESVKAYKDTTFYMMLAGRERGHEVFYFNQSTLQTRNSSVYAMVSRLDVHASVEKPFTVLETRQSDLSDMDVVMIRTDPPFDRGYLYSTLILDLLPAGTRVYNRPSGIRNWNEKLASLNYPQLTPRSVVTRSEQEICQLFDEFDRVTLKPVDGHGGKGIVFLDRNDPGNSRKINDATRGGRDMIIAQEYLVAATEGDKRILLVDGEPIGAVLRVHAEGQELNNLDQGAEAMPAELDSDDLRICETLRSGLDQQGIFFCGIDVIGGKLIEINVTSPTCLQELCRFSGIDHHHAIIERLESS
ncbi:MAG: glutathione synthase [Acidiferrobacterales bacterium]|nr:glutathione synthase [Acidiferrobacterales bacterium]